MKMLSNKFKIVSMLVLPLSAALSIESTVSFAAKQSKEEKKAICKETLNAISEMYENGIPGENVASPKVQWQEGMDVLSQEFQLLDKTLDVVSEGIDKAAFKQAKKDMFQYKFGDDLSVSIKKRKDNVGLVELQVAGMIDDAVKASEDKLAGDEKVDTTSAASIAKTDKQVAADFITKSGANTDGVTRRMYLSTKGITNFELIACSNAGQVTCITKDLSTGKKTLQKDFSGSAYGYSGLVAESKAYAQLLESSVGFVSEKDFQKYYDLKCYNMVNGSDTANFIKGVEESISEGAKNAVGDVKEGAIKVGEWAKKSAKAVAISTKTIAKKVGEGVTTGAKVVIGGVETGAKAVGAGIVTGAEAVAGGVTVAAVKIGEVSTKLAKDAAKAVSNAAQDIRTGAINIQDKIEDSSAKAMLKKAARLQKKAEQLEEKSEKTKNKHQIGEE